MSIRGSAGMRSGGEDGGFQRIKKQPQQHQQQQSSPASSSASSPSSAPFRVPSPFAQSVASNAGRNMEEEIAQQAEVGATSSRAEALSSYTHQLSLHSPHAIAPSIRRHTRDGNEIKYERLAISSGQKAAAEPEVASPSLIKSSAHYCATEVEHDDLDDADTGILISQEDFAAVEQLKANFDEATNQLRDTQQTNAHLNSKMSSLERKIEQMEEERMKENASSYAASEELRSDLSHEVVNHSETMRLLAAKSNDLQIVSRERDMLCASLTHHERELAASHQLSNQLRERVTIMQNALEEWKEQAHANESEVLTYEENGSTLEDIGNKNAESSLIQLSDDSMSSSSLISTLASSTSHQPILHLRRSLLHVFLVQRRIQLLKLNRLESELLSQQQHNTTLSAELRSMEQHFVEVTHALRQLEEEKDCTEKSRKFAMHLNENQDDAEETPADSSQSGSSNSTAAHCVTVSSLLLQLHTRDMKVKRLESENRRFQQRFLFKSITTSLALCTLVWIMLQI